MYEKYIMYIQNLQNINSFIYIYEEICVSNFI